MKNRIIIKKFLKSNKCFIGLFVFIFLFPIIIGMIYALPLPQIVAVESGDLLNYFGTTFGIMGSFFTYRHETNKRKKEKIKELKPTFVVKVDKINDENNIFIVDIINLSQQTVTYLYFYDEFISTIINDKCSFTTTFNKSIDETESINPNCNINMDPKILDADGYPKYVQIICEDVEGNTWNCCYNKINDCGKIYYYPRDIEIV